VHDVVFVIAEANRGWILEGICRDTGRHVAGKVAYHYGLNTLPPARVYFFSHYSLYAQAVNEGRLPQYAKTLVYFTHPPTSWWSQRRLTSSLSSCTRVLSMASTHSRKLISLGVPTDRVSTVLGAADPFMFRPHERGRGAVGFVSAYYARKSPERMVALVRAMPETPFLLLGRGWRESPVTGELASLRNLEIVEAPYSDYPSHYALMDVFVSLSSLEGGPIPLIEAMMSNVFPVCTRTGFAPDLLTQGVNGLLCDVEAPTATIVNLVRRALAKTNSVRESVEHLDWPRYAGYVTRALDH